MDLNHELLALVRMVGEGSRYHDTASHRYVDALKALIRPTFVLQHRKREQNWLRTAARLLQLTTALERMPLSSDLAQHEQRLVSWVKNQRRDPRLCPLQETVLEAIPHWQWSPGETAWLSHAEALEAFRQNHNRNPRARAADSAERALAKWWQRQRAAERAGGLSADREATLRYLERRG